MHCEQRIQTVPEVGPTFAYMWHMVRMHSAQVCSALENIVFQTFNLISSYYLD